MSRGRADEWDVSAGSEFRGAVEKRYDCLAALVDDGGYKRDLIERLESSRSTVDRAIDELIEHGLAERDGEGRYRATTVGRLAAERHRQYCEDLDDLESTADVLAALPEGADVNAAMVAGATVHRVDGQVGPVLSLVEDAVRDASSVRGVLPRLVDSRMLDSYRVLAEQSGTTTELVLSEPLLTSLADRFPGQLRDIAAADDTRVFRGETPPFGLLSIHGAVDVAYVVVYTEMGGIAAVLELTDDRAIEWATDAVGHYISAGTDRTDRLALLDAPDDSVADADSGRPEELPTTLEAEGFDLLSDAFLERRGYAPLLVSWRTGISLGGVAAGQAISRRRPDDGGAVADEVFDRLLDGEDTLLLGPPGTGKSTVCRQVAVQWHEVGQGPVFYRAHGGGSAFESVAELRREIDARDGHTLVVVEDVPSAAARAALRLRSEFVGAESVTFLFDARTEDWSRLDASGDRVRGLETYEMPSLSVDECERLLDRVADQFGIAGVDASSLYESARGADSAVGDFFVAVHHLARLADPVGAIEETPSTTLSVSARETLDRLRSRGQAAVDVGVVVNLLNLCGIPVDPAYVYSVGDPEFVGDALGVLEGSALFSSSASSGLETAPGTVHETWSYVFFEHLLDVYGPEASRESLGRCLTGVFSLADEATRASVADRVGGTSPLLSRVASDPAAWRESFTERLFEGLRDRPRLSPLLDEDVLTTVPDSVRPLQRYRWLGRLAFLAGDVERAGEAFEELYERATDAGNVRYRAAARSGLGRVAIREARYDEAESVLAAALAFANRGNCEGIVTDCLLELGTAAQRRGELTLALQRNQRARDRARRTGDEFRTAKALQNLGTIHQERSNYDTAEALGEEALAIYEALGEQGRVSKTLSNLGNSKRHRGDHEAAASYYGRALDIATEVGMPSQTAAALTNLSDLERVRGNTAAAERYVERAVPLYRRLGDDARLSVALNNLALVRQERGDVEAATEAHEEAYEIRQRIGNPGAIGITEHNLGICARETGDLDVAESWFRDAIDHLSTAGATRAVGLTHAELAEVFVARGDDERALAQLETAVETLERCEARRDAVEARHSLAARLLAVGRVADAHECARRARTLAATL